jgi:predicted transcriptional regulator
MDEMKIERNFFIAPNLIFEFGLSNYEIVIYMYLLRCGNNSTSFPSYKTIGRKTGTSKNTAIRSVKKLIEKGLIVKHSREKKNKNGTSRDSNLYEIKTNLEKILGGSLSQGQGVVSHRDKGVVSGRGSIKNYIINTNNKQQQHINSDKNTQTVEENVKAVVVEDSKIENISQNKEIVRGKDKKEVVKEKEDKVSSEELQEIQEIIGKFKEKYGGNLDESLTKKLILRKGKDKVLKCIDEMEQYVNNADKVERVFYDFVMNCDTNKYTKGTQYNSPGQKFAQGNKPIQATNYEQRVYDDEFYDSLYLNLAEYYPDKEKSLD